LAYYVDVDLKSVIADFFFR